VPAQLGRVLATIVLCFDWSAWFHRSAFTSIRVNAACSVSFTPGPVSYDSCVRPPWRRLEGATSCGQRAPQIVAWPQTELAGAEHISGRLFTSSEVEGSGGVNWRGSPERAGICRTEDWDLCLRKTT